LRELLNNRELSYAPVGFMDDDANKHGKTDSRLSGVWREWIVTKDHSRPPRRTGLDLDAANLRRRRIAENFRRSAKHGMLSCGRLSIRLEAISDNPLKSASQMPMNGDL